MKTFLIPLLLSCSMVVQAQMMIAEVETKKLGHRKTVKYMRNEELRKLLYFAEIQPSISDSCDLSAFYLHHGTYTVNAPVLSTWNTCMTASPSALWKGKLLGLSCVYDVNTNSMFYPCDERHEPLEQNQIYFINLRIARLLNVAAALMVTRIDYDEKLVEFTYIKGNKSIGKQTLRLVEEGDGGTKIVHDTFYKSGSRVRDRRLYPRFHQVAITDLHKRIEEHSTAATP